MNALSNSLERRKGRGLLALPCHIYFMVLGEKEKEEKTCLNIQNTRIKQLKGKKFLPLTPWSLLEFQLHSRFHLPSSNQDVIISDLWMNRSTIQTQIQAKLVKRNQFLLKFSKNKKSKLYALSTRKKHT